MIARRDTEKVPEVLHLALVWSKGKIFNKTHKKSWGNVCTYEQDRSFEQKNQIQQISFWGGNGEDSR